MEQLQPHGLIQDFAVILVVAAVTTVLFQRLKQPVVLGYLLAGLIVGPHIPIPLFVDLDRIHTLSELGVILVMFAIGLEFSFRRLARLATTAGVVGILQICVMFWLGYVLGLSFGWTRIEALYTGGMISVSSTMIIAKAFSDQRITGRLSELVIGILIVEDVAAILMIALLSAFSPGKALPTDVLLTTGLQLSGFLVIALVLGILIVPRAIRAVARLNSDETLLVASVGICFAYSYLAQKGGYSVALGAFIAGALVAESGHVLQIEHLVRPLRDVFAAVFFISVGMLMNPATLAQHWQAILLITLAVLIGKILSVTSGSFVMGAGLRTSVRAGMSMAQIGEFSFIIAGAGLAIGAIREFLYPISIAVCVITTFTTPWLIGISGKTASALDRALPDSMKTMATLYTSWVEKMRAGTKVPISIKRKIARILLIDIVLLTGIAAAFAYYKIPMQEMLLRFVPFSPKFANILVGVLISVVAVPFLISIVRASRTLGAILAHAVLPTTSRLDLADAPRRTMILLLEFAAVIGIGVLLLAVTLPFLPRFAGIIILASILGVFAFFVWRGATDLDAHVRAGAQVIIEALSQRSAPAESTANMIENVLPGLGNISSIELTDSHHAVGKTLADLDIHGLTGALIVGIVRTGNSLVSPSGNEVLRAGDVLAVLGSDESVDQAKQLLASAHWSAKLDTGESQ